MLLDTSEPIQESGGFPTTNYLLLTDYRQVDLQSLLGMSDDKARLLFEDVRWGHLGPGRQQCYKCGAVDRNSWSPAAKAYSCRSCKKQFSILGETRFHRSQQSLQELLAMLFLFVEAKDSRSAREVSGLMGRSYHMPYVLSMKIREAIRDSMLATGKLQGRVQVDAAYFLKYMRPGNVGTGAALHAKAERKQAGLDEKSKPRRAVSPDMHALVVLAEANVGLPPKYRVRVMKTEAQLDLLAAARDFCDQGSHIITDGHSGYTLYGGAFEKHTVVDHSTEFQTEDGDDTNRAEGFFSRIRAAQAGAWHRLTVHSLEYYGWEFAWRLTMILANNRVQLTDLLRRMLCYGRPTAFRDYWHDDTRGGPEGPQLLYEVDRNTVPKRMGRPRKGEVRPESDKPKRKYTRHRAFVQPPMPEAPSASAPEVPSQEAPAAQLLLPANDSPPAPEATVPDSSAIPVGAGHAQARG